MEKGPKAYSNIIFANKLAHLSKLVSLFLLLTLQNSLLYSIENQDFERAV